MASRTYLDFVRRWAAPDWRHWTALGAGVLLAAVAVGAWALEFSRQQQLAAKLQQRQAQIERLQPKAVSLPDNVSAAAAAAAARELGTHWDGLYAALESCDSPTVVLLSLDAQARKGQLTIDAEARNLPAMITYFRALQKLPMLGRVTLYAHQTDKRDNEQPIRFRIGASWRGEP
jgi:Tfp pilus assembly protein PilN